MVKTTTLHDDSPDALAVPRVPSLPIQTPPFMMHHIAIVTLLASHLICSSVAANDPVVEPIFARDIQPLLAKHCLLCHGSDAQEGGLRLDDAKAAQAELDSGEHGIVPGDPSASEVLRRVTADDESLRMPPEGEPLADEEVEKLRRWIEAGAVYETHWAYRPVEQPELPPVEDTGWPRNPIDHFVLARLEAAGLSPSREADRATLIKRLSYDLIGLPPTPQEVDAFVADASPEAYAMLVDRLLESQHFGERWGRHWLDKARYADSDGYEKDRPRPNAWRYRDWVIESINRDQPFDQFTIEQLAGDLLPKATPMQRLATAFHRQTLTNTEGGVDKEEFRVEATFDRTETTGAVWMGLTMNCARCHSHKYDRISHEEYYRLFAFFNRSDEANVDVIRDPIAEQVYEQQQARHEQKVAALTEQLAKARRSIASEVAAWSNQMVEQLSSKASSIDAEPLLPLEATTSSDASLTTQDDKSLLATGPVPEKDSYTVAFGAPERPLTGIRLQALADPTLPGKGPGRTPHGNFVLSRLQLFVCDDAAGKNRRELPLVAAEADFAQQKFPPTHALPSSDQPGWAISPQMGADHQITFFTRQPHALRGRFLQVVIDQQYGGKHTLGRFRIEAISGFDPRRALPADVLEALAVDAPERTPEQRTAIADHVASWHPQTAALSAELSALRAAAPKPPLMSVRVMRPAERETRLLHRGDFLQPADPVTPNGLNVILQTHPLVSRDADTPADRLDLARWLVDPDHPLTTRVTVNQVWSHLFGRGIVATVNDFGVRGDLPTHPALLDWLAWQFPREMQWSRKRLIKTIVMSATYRQASHHRPELHRADPTNRLFGRQNRVRVEAEIVRDLYLAAAGLLSKEVGGPSVFPPLPPGVAELSYANNFKWKTSEGGDRYRRGMYTFFKRTAPHPTLVSFDCPDSNTTQLQRETSNTPLQALVTLNNDVFTEAAQAMASRVLQEGGTTDAARIAFGLRLCIVRQPTGEEVEAFNDLLDTARQYYQEHPDEANKLVTRHRAETADIAENAAWIATMRIVLNLDEFFVRG